MTFLGVGLAAACASDPATPKNGNGVNDVRAACELRLSWNRSSQECQLCEPATINAHCECEALKAFSGLCLDQENARKAACSETVSNCVLGCDRNDCNCITGCYTDGDACKKASDARDGCIEASCKSHCQP